MSRRLREMPNSQRRAKKMNGVEDDNLFDADNQNSESKDVNNNFKTKEAISENEKNDLEVENSPAKIDGNSETETEEEEVCDSEEVGEVVEIEVEVVEDDSEEE